MANKEKLHQMKVTTETGETQKQTQEKRKEGQKEETTKEKEKKLQQQNKAKLEAEREKARLEARSREEKEYMRRHNKKVKAVLSQAARYNSDDGDYEAEEVEEEEDGTEDRDSDTLSAKFRERGETEKRSTAEEALEGHMDVRTNPFHGKLEDFALIFSFIVIS